MKKLLLIIGLVLIVPSAANYTIDKDNGGEVEIPPDGNRGVNYVVEDLELSNIGEL